MLVDLYDMTYLIYDHITVRVPGTDQFLINLYGLTYKEITASRRRARPGGSSRLTDAKPPAHALRRTAVSIDAGSVS